MTINPLFKEYLSIQGSVPFFRVGKANICPTEQQQTFRHSQLSINRDATNLLSGYKLSCALPFPFLFISYQETNSPSDVMTCLVDQQVETED